MWQFPNESNGIRNQNGEILTQLDTANQRIECGKQSSGDQSLFLGQRAKQRRFACVRIADQRDQRQSILTSPFSVELAMFSNLLDVTFKSTDAVTNLPAVHFELRFAGATSANAAAQSRQVLSISRQTRQPVFQLCKLDLELAFFCAGATREDVQNKSGSVDNLSLEGFLQVLCLAGRKLVVEDDHVDTFEKNLFP